MITLKKTVLIVSTILCLGVISTSASARPCCHGGYYNNGYFIYEIRPYARPYYYDNYYYDYTPNVNLNFGGGYHHYRY